jgi:deoxynucleotide monophosphate kinase-like protein
MGKIITFDKGAASVAPYLIGLIGKRRVGKDTAALGLVRNGYKALRFATPLKDMIRAYLAAVGTDKATIEKMIEGDLKEMPVTCFNGHSARYVMQTLGTDWGRKYLGKDIWVQACRETWRQYTYAVVTDVRFKNEAEAIKADGGTLVRIIRPKLRISVDDHKSEKELEGIKEDILISNSGTVAQFHRKLYERLGIK